MDVTKHVAFHKKNHWELWQYVQKNNIPADHKEGEDVVAIDILASNPHWPWIEAYLKKINRTAQSDMIFTKEELQAAQWMEVRTIWRTGYPEPTSYCEYENITYTRENQCDECSAGLKQVDSFRLRKVPSWGRRHFFAPYWIEDELFVNDSVKTAFEEAGITGVDFYPVKNKNGKQVFEGIYQLRIQTILEEALVVSDDFVHSVSACKKCGTPKYRLNHCAKSKYRKEVFENIPDIVHTGDIFGARSAYAARKIVIGQKTYQTIVANNLDRSLLFYPIDLV